jgi:GNAT superfamily N-acetyltransferase
LNGGGANEPEVRALSRDAFSIALAVLEGALMDQPDVLALCPEQGMLSVLTRSMAQGALAVAFRRGEVVGAYASGCLKAVALWHGPDTPRWPTFWEELVHYPALPWRCYLRFRTLWRIARARRASWRACPRRRDSWYLAGLAVLRDARGSGLATLLVKAGQERARLGGEPVTATSVRQALPFYERLGFAREGSSGTARGLAEYYAVLWLADGSAGADSLTPPASP